MLRHRGRIKTAILDQVAEVTDWNRDRTQQQLLAQLKQPPGRTVTTATMIDQRKTRGCECSSDAQLVLQKAWAVSDDSCRQYLAAAMTD